MKLDRFEYSPDGIFGRLVTEDGVELAKTLEHAYPTDTGHYIPKLPNGTYLCVRGIHQLARSAPFETFEITGVPGHTGILFHTGNFHGDSSGCVLVGRKIDRKILAQSHAAFLDFLNVLKGLNSFVLTVS